MRRAIFGATLGDDVFGEDETGNALERRAAELLGKEAAAFVASGTMANLVAMLAHLHRGNEIVAGYSSHLVVDEQAGHAALVGAPVRQLRELSNGTFSLEDLESSFRDSGDLHEPITGLVVIENTHAASMGRPLTPEYTKAVADIAHSHGVSLHIDGARFFNAVVALNVSAAELAAPADSVSFCLSKGLACPIGSLVVGSREFIQRVRRARKLVGGGMRQIGVMAAAGLVALADDDLGMIDRLEDDHVNARRLAQGLSKVDGIESPGGIAQPTTGSLDPDRVTTNFVIFNVPGDRSAFLAALRKRDVAMSEWGPRSVRAVTHYGVNADDIDFVVDVCADAVGLE